MTNWINVDDGKTWWVTICGRTLGSVSQKKNSIYLAPLRHHQENT